MKPTQFNRQNPFKICDTIYEYTFKFVRARLFICSGAIRKPYGVLHIYHKKGDIGKIVLVNKLIVYNRKDLLFGLQCAHLWGNIINDRRTEARMLQMWIREEMNNKYIYRKYFDPISFRNIIGDVNTRITDYSYENRFVRYIQISDIPYAKGLVDYPIPMGVFGAMHDIGDGINNLTKSVDDILGINRERIIF